MRKLYALLTGMFLSLLLPARTPSPDIADFNYNIDHASRNVVFSNLSVLGSEPGNRKAYWTFGDGTVTMTPPLQGTQHQYTHPGTYTVCLKIYRYRATVNDSVLSAQVCRTIIINNVCTADFERIPSPNAIPLNAWFRALPGNNNARKPSKICWTFGDGRDTCINYTENYTGPYTVGHQYAHAGAYEVCVKIFYYGGCDARKCRMIEVIEPDHCSADYERLPAASNNPLELHFKALPQHNNNRKPARICWEFGDGRDTCINYAERYTGQYIVSHRYAQPGNYEVCVKILYYGGCEARKCRLIEIPPPVTTCTVRLFEVTPAVTSLVRGFVAVPNSTPPKRPVRVCWVFGDGEDTCIMIDPSQTTHYLFINHTYPGPGVYRACVRVLFDGGCLAEDCREVVIRPLSDICGGYMRDSLIGPRAFLFKGFSIHDPNDEAISYHWTFGDGASANGREVNHTYDHGGEYRVCLQIRTRLGCETNICRTVRVTGNNQPVLLLSPNPVINNLHAVFLSTQTETVLIKIINTSGTVLRVYQRNVTVGPNTWDFDVATLLPGIYSFVVQSPGQLASAIFIKQ